MPLFTTVSSICAFMFTDSWNIPLLLRRRGNKCFPPGFCRPQIMRSSQSQQKKSGFELDKFVVKEWLSELSQLVWWVFIISSAGFCVICRIFWIKRLLRSQHTHIRQPCNCVCPSTPSHSPPRDPTSLNPYNFSFMKHLRIYEYSHSFHSPGWNSWTQDVSYFTVNPQCVCIRGFKSS